MNRSGATVPVAAVPTSFSLVALGDTDNRDGCRYRRKRDACATCEVLRSGELVFAVDTAFARRSIATVSPAYLCPLRSKIIPSDSPSSCWRTDFARASMKRLI